MDALQLGFEVWMQQVGLVLVQLQDGAFVFDR